MTNGKIAERLEAGAEAESLIVGQVSGDAAVEEQTAKRHYERLKAEFGNEEPMTEPDCNRKKQHRDQRGSDTEMFDGEHPAQQRAGQADG